jgi:hypothetical protein
MVAAPSQVWRMGDPAERDAALALRSARGNRLRKAIGWYRTHNRLYTGDAIAAPGQMVQLLDWAEFCCYLDEVRAARISHHGTKRGSTL